MFKLYLHPLSAYCQKVLIAFYENGVAFEPVFVNVFDPTAKAEYDKNVNPLGKIPFLYDVDHDWRVPESSIIVEYAEQRHPVTSRMIPNDPELSRQVRFRDRMMDLYLNEPMGKIVGDGWRPENERDPVGVAAARARLDKVFVLVDGDLGKKGRAWAAGAEFTLADCAAAPVLARLRQYHPYSQHKNLTAYFERLSQRPSVARVFREAEPHAAAMAKR